MGHAYRKDLGSRMLGSFVGIKGKWRRTAYLRAKLKPDIALVSVKYDGNLICTPIASANPAVGSRVKLIGFPGGNKIESKYGYVQDSSVMLIGASVRGGYSGGGIYTTTGQPELAGIIWGGSKDGTHATCPEILNRFVMEHLGSLPKCSRPKPPQPSRPPNNAPPAEETPPAPPIEDAPPAPVSSSVMDVKIKRLEKRVDELQRDLARIRLKKGDTGPRGEPGVSGPPRTITVIFQDETGQHLTTPVVIPPDKSTVRVPIERIVRSN